MLRAGGAREELASVGSPIVQDDPVAFYHTGDNTLQFFMHRHQPGDPSPTDLANARWIIMPKGEEGTDTDTQPASRSPSLPLSAAQAPRLQSAPMTTKLKHRTLTLGLYPAEAVRAGLIGEAAARPYSSIAE